MTLITASSFVEACIKTVGIEWKTYGHWSHKIIGLFMDECVLWFGSRVFGKLIFQFQKELYIWSQEKMKHHDDNRNYNGVIDEYV